MYDQVENLKNLRNVDNATFLNSDLSIEEINEDIKNGTYDIVYMSPELLLSYSIDIVLLVKEKLG